MLFRKITLIFCVLSSIIIIFVLTGADYLPDDGQLIAPMPSKTPLPVIAPVSCRYGVGSTAGTKNYDISIFRLGGYIDWQYQVFSPLPDGVDYIRMLRVSDFENRFQKALGDIEKIAQKYPGSYYIIGNEPDTIYEDQDGVLPEVYAERFYELAIKIRESDPSAKIGFGTIVQPTPIRMRYLDKAWERLVEISGSEEKASAMIDFWSIHSFILNENPEEWGAGVPSGFEDDYEDAVQISDLDDTHSINIFKQRVRDFRQWMLKKGERNKPLWISEFGSLLPPEDPPVGSDFVNVSDEDTAKFMINAFNFLFTASDTETGLPYDRNRLVQRWFWYSLNDYRYKFGGSLYDPLNQQLTIVGERFKKYTDQLNIAPDLYFMGVIINPINFKTENTKTDYRLDFLVANGGSSDAQKVTLEVYQEKLSGTPVAMSQIEHIAGCGEAINFYTVWLYDINPKDSGWMTAKLSSDGEIETSNNTTWFMIHKP